MTYAPDKAILATPVGMLHIFGDRQRLHRIAISRDAAAPVCPDSPALQAAVAQLTEWFAGERRTFDLPLAPPASARGQVLRAGLIAVGYGETLRYGMLARLLDSGPRAIGQLCARNPFPIIVPCHRIVASDGPGHYSAGDGPVTKQWLLDFERRNLERST